MEQHQGFSLIEVLLSLMLTASTALALMQQQASINQVFTQLLQATQTSNGNCNQSEHLRINA